MTAPKYKPDHATLQRVETLLVEQLQELGVEIRTLEPYEVAQKMVCGVHESGTLTYSWCSLPILRVVPEKTEHGSILWRMFTRDDILV